MPQSRLLVRVAGVALIALVGWYILHLHAEIARLHAELARGTRPAVVQAPAAPSRAGAPPAAPGGSEGARTLTAEQREAMIERLGGRSSSSPYPVWFATAPNNPEAAAFQRTLQSVFEEAGWQVRGSVQVRFPMRAGVYVFAADEEPPEYVSMAHEALEAGGITVTAGRAYREFTRQKKAENPSWVGLELGPDETYVIAVGRRPAAEPAS